MNCKGINFFRDPAIPIRSFLPSGFSRDTAFRTSASSRERMWHAKTGRDKDENGITVPQKHCLYYIFYIIGRCTTCSERVRDRVRENAARTQIWVAAVNRVENKKQTSRRRGSVPRTYKRGFVKCSSRIMRNYTANQTARPYAYLNILARSRPTGTR